MVLNNINVEVVNIDKYVDMVKDVNIVKDIKYYRRKKCNRINKVLFESIVYYPRKSKNAEVE